VENQRPRNKDLLRRTRTVGRVEGPLGDGFVSGLRNEGRVLRVGHLMAIDPKAVHTNAVNRRLLRIEAL